MGNHDRKNSAAFGIANSHGQRNPVARMPVDMATSYVEEDEASGGQIAAPGTALGPAHGRQTSYRQLGIAVRSPPSRAGIVAVAGALLAAVVIFGPRAPMGGSKVSAAVNMVAVKDKHKHAEPEEERIPPFAPLLFCWAMSRSSGYEPDLLSAQFYNKAGIFACDSYHVYTTGGATRIGDIETTEVVAAKDLIGDFKVTGTATDSWLNTATFMKAWDMVIEDGTWWRSDWTVKVDPDAVFFPDRLRTKIEPHTGGLNAEPVWVGNCDRVWHDSTPHLKLFGSLEIFSRNAVGTYKAFGKNCRTMLDWQGWGEDMFMQNCMEMMKVKPINGTDFVGDKRCYDAPCTDINKIAFHDFKAVKPFFECWGQSKGSEKVYKIEQARLKKIADEQEKERLKQEKLLKEKLERERLEREKQEQARLEQERLARERQAQAEAATRQAEAVTREAAQRVAERRQAAREVALRKEQQQNMKHHAVKAAKAAKEDGPMAAKEDELFVRK